jgi:isoleucyl-tRNA synthetase
MIIPVKNSSERKQIESITKQLKGEINIKTIEFLDDANSLLVKEVKPNFRVLGPRFGRDMKAIVDIIQALTDEQVIELEENGTLKVELNKKNIILEQSDVEICFKDIEGWQIAQGNGMTVALDMTLTPELIREGIARELINRIQNFRKDSGLEVTDKIDVFLKKEPKLEAAFLENKSYILSETLTENLTFESSLEEGLVLEFENINTSITIKKNKL